MVCICFVFSEHIVSMYVKGSWGDMIAQTAATNFLNRTIKYLSICPFVPFRIFGFGLKLAF